MAAHMNSSISSCSCFSCARRLFNRSGSSECHNLSWTVASLSQSEPRVSAIRIFMDSFRADPQQIFTVRPREAAFMLERGRFGGLVGTGNKGWPAIRQLRGKRLGIITTKKPEGIRSLLAVHIYLRTK